MNQNKYPDAVISTICKFCISNIQPLAYSYWPISSPFHVGIYITNDMKQQVQTSVDISTSNDDRTML